jgi:peroxiredoxin family protein
MTDETPRHIAFICSKGDLDMAYPALVMGWAALGNGVDVSIFFTFWGLDMITQHRIDKLQLAPVANTSMKMTMMGVPVPKNWGIPNLMGILPGMTRFATWLMRKKIREVGAPPVREYLEMMQDGGAKLYACKMSCDMMGLGKADFIEGVVEGTTAADFIDMTEGAQIIFI